MNKFHFTGIVALFVVVTSLSGCGSGPPHDARNGANANTASVPGETANTARTNVEELSLLVNVPYETDDVVWKEDTVRKKIIAVLHFSKEDAERIVADGAARQAPQNVTIPSESWYPAELIAQSELSGDEGLRGTSYSADGFFMEPYTSGRIIRIAGTDYFVLQLSAR